MFIGGLTVEVLGCCMRDQSHSSSSYIENFANRAELTTKQCAQCQIQVSTIVREAAATVKHLICLIFH
jgi:hypothetical protein